MENQEIIRTDSVTVRVMTLAGGKATEWHYHSEVRDFFVCLTGAVQVESSDPEQTTLLLPGERTEISSGTVHRVINSGNGTAEYLLVQGVGTYDFLPAPAHPEKP